MTVNSDWFNNWWCKYHRLPTGLKNTDVNLYLLTWKNIPCILLDGKKVRPRNKVFILPFKKKKNTKSILVHIKKVQIEKSFKGYKNDNDY